MSSYPNIFDASNCSLISGLIPPGIKKFINAFMNGNLLRNPLGQITGLLGQQIGDMLGRLDVLQGITELGDDLQKLNDNLTKLNADLQRFKQHTDILAGVIRDPDVGYATLDQIIGTMSAYNSMKEVLKDPGAVLEDNFSKAFTSLNPRFVGPFFENFSGNMNEVERLLDEVSYQITLGVDPVTGEETSTTGILATAETLSEIGKLAGNIGQLSDTIDGFIKGDKATYIAAAAALADYALANGLVGSILSDPCFGGQVVMNLISTVQGRDALSAIALENGINVKNDAVDFAGLVASAEYDREPLTELTPTTVNNRPQPEPGIPGLPGSGG
jgi:hypothetical protein